MNGMLALNYHGVCGNKGYSFEYAAMQDRMNKTATRTHETFKNTFETCINENCRGHHPAIVPMEQMEQRGFEDCDWVSFEKRWDSWERFVSEEMELHVPCRDPLDHLMSQCNYQYRQFDCSAGVRIAARVKHCLMLNDRFDMRLASRFDVKCFPSDQPAAYVSYMSQRLRQKRHAKEYIFRGKAMPRNKSAECIWASTRLQEDVRQYLVSTFDYYKFCDRCMASDQRLFA